MYVKLFIIRPNLLHFFFERIQCEFNRRARILDLEFFQYTRMQNAQSAKYHIVMDVKDCFSILFKLLKSSVLPFARRSAVVNCGCTTWEEHGILRDVSLQKGGVSCRSHRRTRRFLHIVARLRFRVRATDSRNF